MKGGEERGFTAAEFKEAQKDGWEKQYQYKVGKKKEYMAPSLAKSRGWSAHPSTPRAPSTAGRIRSPSVGTVTNS